MTDIEASAGPVLQDSGRGAVTRYSVDLTVKTRAGFPKRLDPMEIEAECPWSARAEAERQARGKGRVLSSHIIAIEEATDA